MTNQLLKDQQDANAKSFFIKVKTYEGKVVDYSTVATSIEFAIRKLHYAHWSDIGSFIVLDYHTEQYV